GALCIRAEAVPAINPRYSAGEAQPLGGTIHDRGKDTGPALTPTVKQFRDGDGDGALLPRRDRAHGRLARAHRPDLQLGDHRLGGTALRLAVGILLAPRRAAVRHAAGLPAFDDRGAALPLLRRLPL